MRTMPRSDKNKGPSSHAASARQFLRARQHRADRRLARSREDPGPAARRCCARTSYPGKLYPINPNYDEIDGLKCYQSIADVGAPIDLAIVIIPARAVLGALEQCAAAGVKNAVIISSGFAEEGGDSAAMQDAIVALAKRTGMRISGPNAEGFLQPGAARRRDLQPDRRRQAGRMPRWSRPSGGSASSRRAAASALRSTIAPRRSALRSAMSSAPATKAISAPASSWTTWCRMPRPT